MLCPNIALLDVLQKIQRPEAEEMAAAKLGFLPHDLAPLGRWILYHCTPSGARVSIHLSVR